MMEKVLNNPEIWKINVDLPDSPLKNLNSYVIKTKGGNLVIDTGFNRETCRKALFSGLEELNIDLNKTSLFVTHFHSDHVGLAETFVDKGCTVYMGKIDYDYFCKFWSETEKESYSMDDVYVIEGFPADILEQQNQENDAELFAPVSLFPVQTVEDSDKIWLGDVEVVCIHTPGHTPGHMMLYLPQSQVLFTGDHVLFDITPNISIWKDVENSLGDYIFSLKRTKEICAKTVLPAHRGQHIGMDERIDQILHHHEVRLEEILQAIRENPGATAYEIASKITWSMKGKKWPEAPSPQKWFAMGETLAHLRHLEEEQRVERRESGEQILYYVR